MISMRTRMRVLVSRASDQRVLFSENRSHTSTLSPSKSIAAKQKARRAGALLVGKLQTFLLIPVLSALASRKLFSEYMQAARIFFKCQKIKSLHLCCN